MDRIAGALSDELAPAAAPAAPRQWSTDGVAPRDRLDYWIGAVCDCFLDMDVSSARPAEFQARISSQPLQSLTFNQVQGSPQDVRRTRRGIARAERNFYYLVCKEEAPCDIEQQVGSRAHLLPGDLVLIDSRSPYRLSFPDVVDCWSVELPIDWLEQWLPDAERQLGRRIDGREGFGSALSAYLRELGRSLQAGACRLPPALLADQLGALLALSLPGAAAQREEAGLPAMAARIEACLAERFSEPGLTAAEVAHALGISARTLHRALGQAGHSFAQRLLQHRLRAALRMLRSPAFARVTTAEIGRRAGWPDASHFTRVCRRWLGATPASLREPTHLQAHGCR